MVFPKYNRNSITYANSFVSPWQSQLVRVIEWFTGKVSILIMIRRFEKIGVPTGQGFWRACLDVMGIRVLTPASQIENIPREGPVVVVSNHPHGMIDGMILSELVAKRRGDCKTLTRSFLPGLDAIISTFLIPVPFANDTDAQRKSIEMRAAAMAQLKAGGVIAIFPSGVVAASETLLGPAVEAEWNVFTAQLIRRSGARVVPVFFPGANSRAYQMANRLSVTLRQGLLIHEIARICNRSQTPVVGEMLSDAQMQKLSTDPRGFMAWLRQHTLSLGQD